MNKRVFRLRKTTNRGENFERERYWESDNDRRIYFEPHSICGKRIVGLRFCIVSHFE